MEKRERITFHILTVDTFQELTSVATLPTIGHKPTQGQGKESAVETEMDRNN